MSRPGSVGIVANPASGKDIRRLVAHGSTFDNNEKINIVRRFLLALDAFAVEHVLYMPDTYNIVGRAAEDQRLNLSLEPLPMPVFGHASDSREAAFRLHEAGVAVVLTLGGDGTNRVVASGIQSTPIIPVSTGTNNVFPRMIEGTTAGIAAAAVAHGLAGGAICRQPMLEVVIGKEKPQNALVDAVVSSQSWIGARAFWQAEHVRFVALSHIPATAIGISALGPILFPNQIGSRAGAYATIGRSERKVICPIAPGLLAPLEIGEHGLLESGACYDLAAIRGTLALDGEREIELTGKETLSFCLSEEGPFVVDIDRAIASAAQAGMFDA